MSAKWDPPISRVVLVAVDGGSTFHMRWELESERMHVRAAQFNAVRPQRFRASIEYAYGPEHVPAHVARHGVARVRCAPFSISTGSRARREQIADYETTEALDSVYAIAAHAGKKHEANLAVGPKVAGEKRTAKAAAEHAVIDEVVCDLLKHPDTARLTNEEIRDFLIERGLSKLKSTSTLKIVKRIAARERAKTRKS